MAMTSKRSIYNHDPFPKPEVEVQVLEAIDEKTFVAPPYHVILLDDDYHTYDYVIEMLGAVFGHSKATALDMAHEVDKAGFVIVDTTHKERAELKKDQVESYGADWRMTNSAGSMSAVIEPAENLS